MLLIPASTEIKAPTGRGTTLRRRVGAWLRKLLIACAVAYPLALVAVIVLFRFVGEGWWVTSVALYVPRLPLALPLLVLVPGLLLLRARKLYFTLPVSALLVAFPVMGLETPPLGSAGEGRSIRLLSFNVNLERAGDTPILRAIRHFDPDIVVLQESAPWSEVPKLLKDQYPTVHVSTQFVLATRLNLLSTDNPREIDFYNVKRAPLYMRYLLETPLGKLTLYSVHPHSPRQSFHAVASQRRELLTGHFDQRANDTVQTNTGLRVLQVRTWARAATLDAEPTVIAGDTNLPGLSRELGRELGAFRDGFEEAGSGFGYTFPSRFPWMRIDRVLAKGPLHFRRFEVGCRDLSDHLCVVADLGR
ncbi:MAG TPA: endonuclease/exonuclease/phosphatase family protein [Polyangiaceae bacterium]